MNRLIRYGLYFVVAFSVLAFGAAEVWAFSVVEFVVFLLVFLVVAGGLSKHVILRKCGATVWIPVALFVLLVLFQMVPLPAGFLKVVSPATYELYEQTGFRVQGSFRLNLFQGQRRWKLGGSGGRFLLTGMGLFGCF